MADGQLTYGRVVREPGVAWVLSANTLSGWGDNFARIAVAALIYERTGLALAAAATFAVSVVPAIFSRTLLSPLADRLPYRHVLLGVCAYRAVAIGALAAAAADQASAWVLLALLFASELLQGPEVSAHQMLWLDLLPDRMTYTKVSAVNGILGQLNQVIGLAVGGILLFVVSPVQALLLDAATFLVAMVAFARVARLRARLAEPAPGIFGFVQDFLAGARYLAGNRVLMYLLVLSVCAVWGMTAPEAVAVAYAAEHGASNLGGVLMAAPILGAAAGLFIVGRWPPPVQNDRIIVLALLMPLPLLVTYIDPGVVVAGLLWFACGVLQGFMLPLQNTFNLAVDPALRGRVFGLAGSVAVGCTAVAYLLSGWLADLTSAATTVAIMALASKAAIVVVFFLWPRAELRETVRAAYRSG